MSQQYQGAETGLHQVKQTWSLYSRAPESFRNRLRNLWRSMGFDHGTASSLRYEMDMLMLRTRCAVSNRYRRQVKDLASRSHLCVHLGCGNALFEGWINVDCYPPQPAPGAEILTLDMRRGLPFATGSVAAVFSEHFLEHLSLDVVSGSILPEISRILQPGGQLRIGVPNGEYFIEQYLAERQGASDPVYKRNSVGRSPMTMLNEIAHGYGHRFLYDFQTLESLLVGVGLVNVRRMTPGRSDVDRFKGRDRTDEWRMAMSLYVEAEAPR